MPFVIDIITPSYQVSLHRSFNSTQATPLATIHSCGMQFLEEEEAGKKNKNDIVRGDDAQHVNDGW